FAWDAQERAALGESERIEARNERLWAALEHAETSDSVPNSDEQRQVRITNAYRRMLGRRALAWNPRLEAAAQGHSDHMANTGDFAHEEQGDPARSTPTDRAKLAGYPSGASENISMGRGDPQSAHEGWTHSSGHHRNLLMQSHREMASAIASSYWTQNFGTDASFQSDL
ncbi:MAG TPA: CAP domain-containing protein, partial [Planctomycetota bacterium]|nr:CAP domain-containing protein [Planctomycetota bacterium]